MSIKVIIFEGKVLMFHSILTSTHGLEAAGILFNNFLKHELKSLIFSFGLALRFYKSFIKVEVLMSSQNFLRNFSSNVSQSTIDPSGREKYEDPVSPSNV